MDVKTAIETRRAYRSLDPAPIDEALVRDLAECASLAPSCFNKQPWRFVFVYGKEALEKIKDAFSPGNAWCRDDSMVVAVFSKKELDCIIKDGREYWQFDTGMASALLMLAATERNLVAHPIAGFDPQAARQVLALPEGAQVITLIIVGGHTQEISPALAAWQIAAETERPARMPFEGFATIV